MIIDRSKMPDNTGWTEIETNGTITFNQSSPAPFISAAHKKTSGSDWHTCGLLRTTPQTGAGGQAVYWCYYHTANTDFMMGITNTNSIAFAGKMAIYDTGTNRFIFWGGDGNPLSELGANVAWYDMKIALNSDGSTNFYIKADGAGSWTTCSGSTAFDIRAADIYFFTNLYADDGNSYPVADWAYTDDGTFTPPVPTTLAAVTSGMVQINLTWSDSTITTVDTDRISIERSLTGGGAGFAAIGTANVGDEAYSDATCSPGTTYYYRIRAQVDWSGDYYSSAYTSEANATTLSAPSGASSSDKNIRKWRHTNFYRRS